MCSLHVAQSSLLAYRRRCEWLAVATECPAKARCCLNPGHSRQTPVTCGAVRKLPIAMPHVLSSVPGMQHGGPASQQCLAFLACIGAAPERLTLSLLEPHAEGGGLLKVGQYTSHAHTGQGLTTDSCTRRQPESTSCRALRKGATGPP